MKTKKFIIIFNLLLGVGSCILQKPVFADSVAEGAVVCSNMSKAATITYPGTYPAFTSTIKCVDNSCSPATARLIGGRTVFIANGQGDNAGSRPVVILLHGTNIASWTAFCANNFNFGLEYKAKMVKNLVNAGYTVVAPQTAWGDRVQHPRFSTEAGSTDDQFYNQWRSYYGPESSAESSCIDLWAVPLDTGPTSSRCASPNGACIDKHFFSALMTDEKLFPENKNNGVILIGFSSGGYMVSRLIAGCHNLNESGIKCPEIMAAVINSAGYYKWPHNYYGDFSSTTFPRINEDYFTNSPNKTLLLWGENDNVIKPKSQLSDFYKKLNNGNIVVSHKKCGVCGHQWLPYVADNDFVTWLST